MYLTEKLAHVCSYYGIYIFKVHVHYIAFATILYYDMYFIYILVNIDQNQKK